MRPACFILTMWTLGSSMPAHAVELPGAPVIQWSGLIVQARVAAVSERIELRSVAIKASAGQGAVSAVYWYRIYSLEIEHVLDGAGVKPEHRVEVIRFFGRVSPAGPPGGEAAGAPSLPTRNDVGTSLLLCLIREKELKMQRPPAWNDPTPDPRTGDVKDSKAWHVLWAAPARNFQTTDLVMLGKRIGQQREADKRITDDAIRKLREPFIAAETPEQAASQRAALKAMGYRAVARLKSARDKKETPPPAKKRLDELIDELSPPPITIELGDARE